jgi:hypothetical protein
MYPLYNNNKNKSGMDETQGLRFWGKFLFSCEYVKPNKLYAPKIQWWDRHKVDFSISKERNGQKKKITGPKWVQNLTSNIKP